jgi:hypothetical protein
VKASTHVIIIMHHSCNMCAWTSYLVKQFVLEPEAQIELNPKPNTSCLHLIYTHKKIAFLSTFTQSNLLCGCFKTPYWSLNWLLIVEKLNLKKSRSGNNFLGKICGSHLRAVGKRPGSGRWATADSTQGQLSYWHKPWRPRTMSNQCNHCLCPS